MRIFIICTHLHILIDRSIQGETGGQDMWHAWESRGKCKGFWWESQKRSLGRPRRKWEDVIGMGIRETGWRSVEWMQLAQDRDRWLALVNMVMNLRVLAPRS
jgi:hypothetical protein